MLGGGARLNVSSLVPFRLHSDACPSPSCSRHSERTSVSREWLDAALFGCRSRMFDQAIAIYKERRLKRTRYSLATVSWAASSMLPCIACNCDSHPRCRCFVNHSMIRNVERCRAKEHIYVGGYHLHHSVQHVSLHPSATQHHHNSGRDHNVSCSTHSAGLAFPIPRVDNMPGALALPPPAGMCQYNAILQPCNEPPEYYSAASSFMGKETYTHTLVALCILGVHMDLLPDSDALMLSIVVTMFIQSGRADETLEGLITITMSMQTLQGNTTQTKIVKTALATLPPGNVTALEDATGYSYNAYGLQGCPLPMTTSHWRSPAVIWVHAAARSTKTPSLTLLTDG
jgi:hypothetical protein